MPPPPSCSLPAARCTPCDPSIAALRENSPKGRTIAAALVHGLFVTQTASPESRILSLQGCESSLDPFLLRSLERRLTRGGAQCVPPTGGAHAWDVVIGDLGHPNSTQAFHALWAKFVSPGGAYVLESSKYGQARFSRRGIVPFVVMEDSWSERMGAWTDALITHTSGGSDANEAMREPTPRWASAHLRSGDNYVRGNAEALTRVQLHALPTGAALVGCGVAACVVIKHSPSSRPLTDVHSAARSVAGTSRPAPRIDAPPAGDAVGGIPPLGSCTTASATVPWMRQLVFHSQPVSDKSKHYYEVMYALFAAPLARAAASWHRPIRLFEIGLGCSQMTKHGNKSASVELWRRLLPPSARIYEADHKQGCVDKINKARILGDGVHAVHGDQSDNATLRRWVHETGGNFDIIIDDGSHVNHHILLTFVALWPEVRAGGLYFLEDLHVGRRSSYDKTGGHGVVSEVIQAWQYQLLTGERFDAAWAGARALPLGAAFVGCSHHICVVMKDAHSDASPNALRA